jgi:hypothetical protein
MHFSITRVVHGGCFIAVVLIAVSGCDAPQDTQAKKDNRGIFGKKTQEVGEFDSEGGATVDDGKVNKQQLATPGIGALAAYGPAAQQVSKLAVQQALNLFHATNDRYPKDHAEFMEKIIKANNIQLPVLPGGRQYQYDVENHELVVVEPAEAEDPLE